MSLVMSSVEMSLAPDQRGSSSRVEERLLSSNCDDETWSIDWRSRSEGMSGRMSMNDTGMEDIVWERNERAYEVPEETSPPLHRKILIKVFLNVVEVKRRVQIENTNRASFGIPSEQSRVLSQQVSLI